MLKFLHKTWLWLRGLKNRYRVFISYSQRDIWIAERIQKDLEDLGAEVVRDSTDIGAGDNIAATIREKLDQCDVLLVLLSPSSIESPWVLWELGVAKALNKPVLPFLLNLNFDRVPPMISGELIPDVAEISKTYHSLIGNQLNSNIPDSWAIEEVGAAAWQRQMSSFRAIRHLHMHRRPWPMHFALIGALGNLSMQRINTAVFAAFRDVSDRLATVTFCDTEAEGADARITMYARALAYGVEKCYFSEDLLALPPDVDRSKILKDASEPARWLTKLGQFVMDNYRDTSDAPKNLENMLKSVDSCRTDWVIYLAVPPKQYRFLIDIVYRALVACRSPTNTNRIMVALEKPFAVGDDKVSGVKYAEEIVGKLNDDWSNSALRVVLTDHYGAKFPIAELALNAAQVEFQEFMAGACKIVIEMTETIDVPDERLEFMLATGLYYDMMPHALLILRVLLDNIDVEIESAEFLAVGSYQGYDCQIKRMKSPPAEPIRQETYFSLHLRFTADKRCPIADKHCPIDVYIRSGKALAKSCKRVIVRNGSSQDVTVDLDRKEITGPVSPVEGQNEARSLFTDKEYRKIVDDLVASLGDDEQPSDLLLEFLSPDQGLGVMRTMDHILTLAKNKNGGRCIRKLLDDYTRDHGEYESTEEFLLEDLEKPFSMPPPCHERKTAAD